MTTTFRRSRTNRMIGGVLSGLADTLNIDAMWLRLGVVVLALLPPMGAFIPIVYALTWLIVPSVDDVTNDPKLQVQANLDEMRAFAEKIVDRIRKALSV